MFHLASMSLYFNKKALNHKFNEKAEYRVIVALFLRLNLDIEWLSHYNFVQSIDYQVKLLNKTIVIINFTK